MVPAAFHWKPNAEKVGRDRVIGDKRDAMDDRLSCILKRMDTRRSRAVFDPKRRSSFKPWWGTVYLV